MKYRAWILPLMIGVTLSVIYLLPKPQGMSPAAISMRLPDKIGEWFFRHIPPSQDELNILAKDTQFSKAVCLSPRPDQYDFATGQAIPDRIDLSIVLSGHDLNNSIHRPERCMPAQGHVIYESDRMALKLQNGKSLPVRRLLSTQTVALNPQRTEFASYKCVTYYFFVGHKVITEDHTKRTLIDMKDRMLHGTDQHWAYISASMWYGKLPWIEEDVSLEEADQKLQGFIEKLALEQINWSEIN